MPDRRVIVGQIGCGAFARGQDMPNFARNPHTTVKWCCDISLEQAQRLAEPFAVPRITTDFMDIVNDPDVNLVKIATSHEAHLPIIRAAAAAGKHIFCEKPMAVRRDEGIEIIRAVRAAGVKLCVDLNRRMSPAMQALRARWQAHRAAPRHHPWRYIEIERNPFPEEENTHFLARIQDDSASHRLVHLDPLRGGGEIIGESVHWIDLACWFFAPQRPVQIQAWGTTRFSHGIHLTFPAGDTATVIYHCGGTFDYPKELYEVTSQGALFRSLCFLENEYFGVPGLDRETFDLQLDDVDDGRQGRGFADYLKRHGALMRRLNRNCNVEHGRLVMDKGHARMLDAFVDSILDGGPSPCDEIAGYASSVLAQLAIRSIETRQVLPVLPDVFTPCVVA